MLLPQKLRLCDREQAARVRYKCAFKVTRFPACTALTLTRPGCQQALTRCGTSASRVRQS
eukprot:359379-Chlamydomonas_euryale.AAC.5